MAFELSNDSDWFEYDKDENHFFISIHNRIGLTEFGKTQVAESEFLELVKMLNKC